MTFVMRAVPVPLARWPHGQAHDHVHRPHRHHVFRGVGFAVFDDGVRQNYAIIGSLLVAILWMTVGFIGRRECGSDRSMQPQDRTRAS